jgi:hypothetical protein
LPDVGESKNANREFSFKSGGLQSASDKMRSSRPTDDKNPEFAGGTRKQSSSSMEPCAEKLLLADANKASNIKSTDKKVVHEGRVWFNTQCLF